MAAEHALRNHDFRRDLVDADDPQAVLFEHARHAGEQLIVAAAKEPTIRGINRSVCQSSRICQSGGRNSVPMNTTSRHCSARARRKPASWPIAIQ